MKKTIKFFLVAVAASAMMFSACKKEDENSGSTEQTSTELTTPEFILPINGSETGTSEVKFSWSSVKNGEENATINYTLSISQDNGQTWTDYDNGNQCQYTLTDKLPKGIVYQAKVIANYSDSEGSKELESKTYKLVSQYIGGLFGATELTTSSITYEWTDMLDYDYVEFTQCEVTIDILGDYIFEDLDTVKIENEKSYTITGLTENKRVGMKCRFFYDGKCVARDEYVAMAIDGTRYIHDGSFQKIKKCNIPEINQSWVVYNLTNGNEYCCSTDWIVNKSDGYTISDIAYQYHPATDEDWKVLEKYVGILDEDLEKVYAHRGTFENASKLLADGTNETGLGLEYTCYSFVNESSVIQGFREFYKDKGIYLYFYKGVDESELGEIAYKAVNRGEIFLAFVKNDD